MVDLMVALVALVIHREVEKAMVSCERGERERENRRVMKWMGGRKGALVQERKRMSGQPGVDEG